MIAWKKTNKAFTEFKKRKIKQRKEEGKQKSTKQVNKEHRTVVSFICNLHKNHFSYLHYPINSSE